MNKFEVLLSLIAKIQEEYLGAVVETIVDYGYKASVDVKLMDGSKIMVDVMYRAPGEPEEKESRPSAATDEATKG